MQSIIDSIDVYLGMDTQYAIMVTGPWGVGKTHFFRESVMPGIERTPVCGNAGKHYKPVLISLFGQKSIEDVQAAILVALYPLLGSSVVQLSASVMKGLLKGYLKLKGLGQFSDGLEKVKVKKGELINFEDLVLIFDDLERLSGQLPLAELIGYVNSLVESQNVKVIIITNEDRLDKDIFRALKEKTIGNTLQFLPSMEESIKNLIGHKFNGSPAFKGYLQGNIGCVIDAFVPHSKNLRILSLALSYYQFIYREIDNVLAKVAVLKDKKDEILRRLLRFIIAISIEYCNGEVDYSNRRELDRTDRLSLQQLFAERAFAENKKKKPEEREYFERFGDIYYGAQDHDYFSSVFDLVTGGGKLDSDQLEQELRRAYHVQDNIVALQYALLDQLRYPVVYALSDKDYLAATRKTLEYAEKGAFDLHQYPTVFHYVARFGNPLNIALVRLQARIIAGMKRGKGHYTYVHNLDMHFGFNSESPDIAHIKAIIDEALRLNKEIGAHQEANAGAALAGLFFTNLDKFTDAVLDREGDYYYKGVLQVFNEKKVYRHLTRLDNLSLVKVIRVLHERAQNPYRSKYGEERSFLEALDTLVKKKAEQLNGKNVLGSLWSELHVRLTEYIAYLP
jgi:hypothetical protein